MYRRGSPAFISRIASWLKVQQLNNSRCGEEWLLLFKSIQKDRTVPILII